VTSYKCLSWICVSCRGEGTTRRELVDGTLCPDCKTPVESTGEVQQDIDTGEIMCLRSEPCDTCGDGLAPGVLFPWNADMPGLACVERCDTCKIYETDDEAGAALEWKLQSINGLIYGVQLCNASGFGPMESDPRLAVVHFPSKVPLVWEEGNQLVRDGGKAPRLSSPVATLSTFQPTRMPNPSVAIVVDGETLDLGELLRRYTNYERLAEKMTEVLDELRPIVEQTTSAKRK